ncbi:MAG TPA: DUF167 domain-containing protein [Tepidisphaeraceae bacterium]|nr:DUF167 domain-containing protein [Tepidisphaeraceae bacterium]
MPESSATLNVKVVPGAKRDRVVGRYGDGVKVQVSAPPEDGKANRAVVGVLAASLGGEGGAGGDIPRSRAGAEGGEGGGDG